MKKLLKLTRFRKIPLKIYFIFLIFFGPKCLINATEENKTPSSREYPYQISQYVVGPKNQADYQTIQSALDKANEAGGGTIYVKPGLYTEDLTLYNGVDMWAAIGVSDGKTCIIKGTHTPPLHGNITLRNVFFESEKDILNSQESGDANIYLIDCTFSVLDGYVLNLPNWSGVLSGFNLGDMGSKNNGGINNLGGSPICLYNLTLGAGSKRPMIISGPVTIFNAIVQPPMNLLKKASGLIAGGSLFRNTISFFDEASLKFYNSVIDSNSNPAIRYYSSRDTRLALVVIDSSSNPVIDGKAEGKLIIGSVVFTDNINISSSVSIDDKGTMITGRIVDLDSSTKLQRATIVEGTE